MITIFQHKILQHCWTLRMFDHHCCEMLLHVVVQIWPFSNLSQPPPTCWKRLAKHLQHVASNNVVIFYVLMLQSFGQGLRLKTHDLKHCCEYYNCQKFLAYLPGQQLSAYQQQPALIHSYSTECSLQPLKYQSKWDLV